MAILTYPKDSNAKLSDHFSLSEFRCPCSQCTSIILESDLVTKLEAIRIKLAKPLRINSGYRCRNYQTELRLKGYETSIGPSQHELGRAADIMSEPVVGVDLEKVARACGIRAVGVGSNWVHIDLRNDKDRRWEYVRR